VPAAGENIQCVKQEWWQHKCANVLTQKPIVGQWLFFQIRLSELRMTEEMQLQEATTFNAELHRRGINWHTTNSPVKAATCSCARVGQTALR
jgi:hypothetical protein